MMTLRLTLFAALLALSNSLWAASISIGPFGFDSAAGVTSASFTGSGFENVSGAITDTEVTTYIKGTSADAAAALTFGNIALSNQSGNDLALFFITADNTVSLTVNGLTSGPLTSSQLYVNPADPFVDNGEQYLIEGILLPDGSLGIASLSVIFVDLDTFGLGFNQSINNINVNLGNNASLLSYAVGMHGTAVPLPAPFLLFLSGLTGLGIISRRK